MSFWKKSQKIKRQIFAEWIVFFAARISEEKPRERNFFEDLSPRFKVHFVCFYRRESLFSNGNLSIGIVSLDFLVELMLNSSSFFRKDAQIGDSFVVWFSSHGLKILSELRIHYAGIVKRISFEYRSIWGFQINYSKNNFSAIILFSFIHNSSSKNDRKITASKLLTHRFSAGCVGEFLQFWLSAWFPQTNFDTKGVNLVLPMLPKGNTVNFYHFFFYVYCKNCFWESLC